MLRTTAECRHYCCATLRISNPDTETFFAVTTSRTLISRPGSLPLQCQKHPIIYYGVLEFKHPPSPICPRQTKKAQEVDKVKIQEQQILPMNTHLLFWAFAARTIRKTETSLRLTYYNNNASLHRGHRISAFPNQTEGKMHAARVLITMKGAHYYI
jgi:hypothetical protein